MNYMKESGVPLNATLKNIDIRIYHEILRAEQTYNYSISLLSELHVNDPHPTVLTIGMRMPKVLNDSI